MVNCLPVSPLFSFQVTSYWCQIKHLNSHQKRLTFYFLHYLLLNPRLWAVCVDKVSDGGDCIVSLLFILVTTLCKPTCLFIMWVPKGPGSGVSLRVSVFTYIAQAHVLQFSDDGFVTTCFSPLPPLLERFQSSWYLELFVIWLNYI